MANLNFYDINSAKNKTRPPRPFDPDCYETPGYVLDAVLSRLNPDMQYIFEPFRGSGFSTDYMRQKGFVVTNGDYDDFFLHDTKPSVPAEAAERQLEMVVVTNPPFSKKKQILEKFKALNITKMALLLPPGTLFLKYWVELFPQNNVQLILHQGRVKFLHPETHIPIKGSCSFDITWTLSNFQLIHDIAYMKA